uniref:Uncharacterized protein n=1 Tax=Triparma pacifica TaxID=91992 RepID=A0A7S2QV20_9STRA|mmetsp:Transcript_1381/g.2527  ORF Transcript_1381/g.2527 Transcript_1381/m.2527 type:complete len:414 (+) Transcript_1381:210-1451(+)
MTIHQSSNNHIQIDIPSSPPIILPPFPLPNIPLSYIINPTSPTGCASQADQYTDDVLALNKTHLDVAKRLDDNSDDNSKSHAILKQTSIKATLIVPTILSKTGSPYLSPLPLPLLLSPQLTSRYLRNNTRHPVLLYNTVAWLDVQTTDFEGIVKGKVKITSLKLSSPPPKPKSKSSNSPNPQPLPPPTPFPIYPKLLNHMSSPYTLSTITLLQGYPRSGITNILKNMAKDLKCHVLTPTSLPSHKTNPTANNINDDQGNSGGGGGRENYGNGYVLLDGTGKYMEDGIYEVKENSVTPSSKAHFLTALKELRDSGHRILLTSNIDANLNPEIIIDHKFTVTCDRKSAYTYLLSALPLPSPPHPSFIETLTSLSPGYTIGDCCSSIQRRTSDTEEGVMEGLAATESTALKGMDVR